MASKKIEGKKIEGISKNTCLLHLVPVREDTVDVVPKVLCCNHLWKDFA